MSLSYSQLTQSIFCILSALASFGTIANTSPNNEQAWFRATPLQTSYQQLVKGHPQQAWHELINTLSTTTVHDSLWQPIKEVILTQTLCGQALQTTSARDLMLTVSFIQKFNQTFHSYQVRLSVETLTEPLTVRLTSAQGETLIEQELAPATYAEVESRDLLSPYMAGVYWLTLGSQRIALLISAPDATPWIKQTNTDNLQISLPLTLSNCSPALARWQFFDQHFTLLESQIINHSQALTLPPIPSNARWRSLSVTKSEYQGAIRVEQIQRRTMPINTPQKENKDIPVTKPKSEQR